MHALGLTKQDRKRPARAVYKYPNQKNYPDIFAPSLCFNLVNVKLDKAVKTANVISV